MYLLVFLLRCFKFSILGEFDSIRFGRCRLFLEWLVQPIWRSVLFIQFLGSWDVWAESLSITTTSGSWGQGTCRFFVNFRVEFWWCHLLDITWGSLFFFRETEFQELGFLLVFDGGFLLDCGWYWSLLLLLLDGSFRLLLGRHSALACGGSCTSMAIFLLGFLLFLLGKHFKLFLSYLSTFLEAGLVKRLEVVLRGGLQVFHLNPCRMHEVRRELQISILSICCFYFARLSSSLSF